MGITGEPGMRLSEAEQAAVDYINAHIDDIAAMSITDISQGAYVSNATVSRAIRKCGFASLAVMKVSLMQDAGAESRAYTVNRILSKSYQECVETLRLIDIDAILRTVEMIYAARRVFVIANGLTALVAEEFTTYLQYQNINAMHTADTNVMRVIDRMIGEGDLLVIISVKNTMQELEIAAGLAKKAGAEVVALCCRKGTALEKHADLMLYGSTQELGPHLTVDTASRLGLFIITRTITEYMHTAK